MFSIFFPPSVFSSVTDFVNIVLFSAFIFQKHLAHLGSDDFCFSPSQKQL